MPRWSFPVLVLLGSLVLVAAPAGAVTLGSINDFEIDEEGWQIGPRGFGGPMTADGGPGGMGDGYLELVSSGGFGAGSKLVMFNQTPSFQGDYTAVGATTLRATLRNFSAQTLQLRLQIEAGNGSVVSTSAVVLAPMQGWTQLDFGLTAADLTGANATAVLGSVSRVRVMHNPTATIANSAPPIAATLGMDDVSIVPEPGAAVLGFAGVATVGIAACRRGRWGGGGR